MSFSLKEKLYIIWEIFDQPLAILILYLKLSWATFQYQCLNNRASIKFHEFMYSDQLESNFQRFSVLWVIVVSSLWLSWLVKLRKHLHRWWGDWYYKTCESISFILAIVKQCIQHKRLHKSVYWKNNKSLAPQERVLIAFD